MSNGNFSRDDTFDRLKHYVSVRLQQGVPIVDADWNEAFDIRKFELEAFLKWFVGSGVPLGNEGFAIKAIPAENDFWIKGGDGLDNPGRCLVDGWDVINEHDIKYTQQRLYENEALAQAWGVDPIKRLSPPDQGERTDTVYLDVWEREVGAEEDYEHLVNPAIGLETCLRMKREWVVRVAPGLEDVNGLVDYLHEKKLFNGSHVYYPLASLHRIGNKQIIRTDDIADLRLTGLSIMSHYDLQQIMADAYGPCYDLDHDGKPNLKMSLREAINAVLRGVLPSTPPRAVTSDASTDRLGFAIQDNNRGSTWIFWTSERTGQPELWCTRYNWDSGTWENDTQLTTDSGIGDRPCGLIDMNGDVWVFWGSNKKGNYDIWYNRYFSSTEEWGKEPHFPDVLTEGTAIDVFPLALEDKRGNISLFWWREWQLWHKLYNRSQEKWLDEIQFTSEGLKLYFYALEDGQGDIWVFWNTQSMATKSQIWYKRYDSSQGTWEAEEQQLTGRLGDEESGDNVAPLALLGRNGDIWVFWKSDRNDKWDIFYDRYSPALDEWGTETLLTTESEDLKYGFSHIPPFALLGNNGDVWLFWRSDRSGKWDIFYNRYNVGSGGWGDDMQLTREAGENLTPFALEDRNQDISIIFRSNRNGNWDVWYGKLFLEL